MAIRRDARILCFGEVLLRLSAPGAEFLLQTPRLETTFGGAEANVAVSLARFGHDVRMLSVLPDNAIGRAATDELRRYGVDVSALRTAPGRMGLYFFTPGAVRRASQVLYDRAESAFARAGAEAIDWSEALTGAGWLHFSGVTAALGPASAAAAIAAAKAARAAGVTVSFDCNYRAKLWAAWDGDPRPILNQILGLADVVFGDHRDIALILGRRFEGEGEAPRAAAAKLAFETWPGLQRMASTRRIQHSVNHHDLAGFMFDRSGDVWETPAIPLTPIVDRIGGGDAFAAGVIHGLRRGLPDARTVAFALAAAALKHSIPGDFNLALESDVESLLSDGGLDVRR
ncbi:PfkB family carbohydrate kinase [Caulobacter sp. KR2-114]|uniref:PfkB family carbohydrate kinase n=1 Tax=Caulobacter sp. KR2-114 TaxID=3400912 RepID=UPI003C0E85F0